MQYASGNIFLPRIVGSTEKVKYERKRKGQKKLGTVPII
jgi:hypothetical protein